jgi:hypothetical protein
MHVLLTSALAGGVSFTLLLLSPGERAPRAHWIGSWMDPRAGLDDVEKRKFLTLPGLKLRPLGRPAHSEATNLVSVTRGRLRFFFSFTFCMSIFGLTGVLIL